MRESSPAPRASPLVIIFVTIFIDLLGFGIIIPLLPFYAESFGANALMVGLLSSSYSLMQFLFAPVWGRVSDRVGRRPIILLGLIGSAVSYLIFGLATSLTVLFVSRITAGIAGANIPTAQAFIADTTAPENRARGMGIVGAAFGLGFIFGPAVGGFLSQWGYALPSFFASALALVNFVAAFFLLPESRPRELRQAERATMASGRVDSLRRALTRPFLPTLLLLHFTVITGFAGFEATFALFGERQFAFTSTTIGYIFAFIGVVLAIVQGALVGRVVRRIAEQRLVSMALFVLAVGLLGVALSGTITTLTVASGLIAVGLGFNNPSIASLISRLSSQDEQGGILGVTQSLASLARVIGPAWGGFTFDQYGISVPFIVASLLVCCACGLSVVGLRRVRLGPAVPVGVAVPEPRP